MNKKILIGIMAGLLVVVFGLMFFTQGGQQSQQKATEKLQVVTSLRAYQEPLTEILGDKGTATALITSSNTDPHDFEPSTADAKTINDADLIVANGLGYDSFMNRLAKNSSAKLLLVGEDVYKLKSGANPHLWFKLDLMDKLVPQLVQQLSVLSPANKAYFQKNADKYLASLKEIKSSQTAIKTAVKALPNKKVFVSEPVFDYALTGYGFEIANSKFEEAIEKEADPSPAVLETMKQQIQNKEISLFVNNKQVESSIVTQLTTLAKDNGIPVFAVTETMPNNLTYKTWIEQLNQQLLAEISSATK